MDVILGFTRPIVEALSNRDSNTNVNLKGDTMGLGREADLGKKEDDGTIKSVPEGETLLGHLVKETDDKTVITGETLNILIAGAFTFFSIPRIPLFLPFPLRIVMN